MPGSDLNADMGFGEGGFSPIEDEFIALWKTKTIKTQ